jgi:hypothetical protein
MVEVPPKYAAPFDPTARREDSVVTTSNTIPATSERTRLIIM